MDYHEAKTLKEQVGYILLTRKETRNSDAELITTVCAKFFDKHGNLYDPIKVATSIERCRRWFNQHGKYLPTIESVARQRKMNIDEWRVALGYCTVLGTHLPPSIQGSKVYPIKSRANQNQIYFVRDFGDRMTCSCPSFKYRQDCRHVRQIKAETGATQLSLLNNHA